MSKTLKFGIFLLALLSIGLLVITVFNIPLGQKATASAVPSLEPSGIEDSDPILISAVEKVLKDRAGVWLEFDYQIDHIKVQDDGQMAIVWLVAIDHDTREVIGREPELALAELGADGKWQVLLDDDEKFSDAFKKFQYADKSVQGDLLEESAAMPKSTTVYGGYYLPWAENLEKRLTWSVAHSSCTPTYYCTHAFDFADGTMFPMVAAKGGTVYHWKDSCTNGDSSCTNSITLEDRSTTPWTYQIYLHIAKNSVPTNLKQVGARVLQGQYIADVDDTGYSSGHHVHYMVVTENTRYMSWNGYVWGVAEDITFRDVDINWDAGTQGGRPRLKYEADSYGGEGRTYYISGNKPAHPPTGGLSAPATKTYITNRNLTVSGWGSDDIAVVKMEILANYDGIWVPIGTEQSANPFTTSVDLCTTEIPNGPFSLGLQVWDYEGNPSGVKTIRKLIKNVECSTTGTNPTVAIVKNEGTLALPENGFVSAQAANGITGNEIVSVAFWFHHFDWENNSWMLLGTDTNGSNGWQAPISTVGLLEADNYILMAVVTDSAGNKGVDVSFNAMVDKTVPLVNVVSVRSPVMENVVNLTWTADDSQTGLDYYSLAVKINQAEYLLLDSNLSRTTTSYPFSVEPNQLLVFNLIAYDKSGNKTSRKIAMYTDGYEFPNSYIMPTFFFGD